MGENDTGDWGNRLSRTHIYKKMTIAKYDYFNHHTSLFTDTSLSSLHLSHISAERSHSSPNNVECFYRSKLYRLSPPHARFWTAVSVIHSLIYLLVYCHTLGGPSKTPPPAAESRVICFSHASAPVNISVERWSAVAVQPVMSWAKAAAFVNM